MNRWAQDFDFYLSLVDDKPAGFFVDLNARAHAPLATHPLALRIQVPMLRPLPSGLRDSSELEPLGVLEDQFADALREKADAVYVGRMVTQGITELFFYVPDEQEEALQNLPALTGAPPPGYKPRWSVEVDEDWEHFNFLLPDAYSLQSIWNRRLVQTFAERGDKLETPREIDHLAYFPSLEAAQTAHKALLQAGFRCDEISAVDTGGEYSLQFHRQDALSEGRPDEFVGEILDILQPLDALYDGWGSYQVNE